MSLQNQKSLWYAILPALAVLFLPLCLRSNLEPGAQQHRPDASHGRFTQRQILARARSVCGTLAPEKTDLRLEAEKSEATAGRIWAVYVSDAGGEHVLYLQWDADTGSVQIAGCPAKTLPKNGGPPLPRQAVVQAGREWLRVLWGPQTLSASALQEGARTPAWRLVDVSPPRSGCLVWDLVWQAERETARLRLDPYTGSLLLAKRKEGA